MAGYLTEESALAVLKIAQEGGYLETSLPENEMEILELADFYISHAQKEASSSAKMKNDPVIKQILAIRSASLEQKSERNYQEFANRKEQLPIPPDIERDATPLPLDFTLLGDKEVRQLHGEYNAYLGRARWLLAQAINKLSDTTHLRDDAYRKAYAAVFSKLSLQDARPTKDLVDSLAKDEKEYKKYDEDVRKYNKEVVTYKALVEIYDGNVDRLSREWTFRQNEWEKTR